MEVISLSMRDDVCWFSHHMCQKKSTIYVTVFEVCILKAWLSLLTLSLYMSFMVFSITLIFVKLQLSQLFSSGGQDLAQGHFDM